ncbi:hypothetical protein DL95DRAFT_418987 [Leptodontidium sp. 2 PMI_412]|nr:hypothetical protein DL95DRAFT_418987 [Leptodontidium sp. 2 PMI_412]
MYFTLPLRVGERESIEAVIAHIDILILSQNCIDEHETDVVDPDDRGLSAVHEQQNLCVDSHHQISPTVHAQHENLFVDPRADDFRAEQTSDDSRRSVDLDVWPPSSHNDDTSGQDNPQEKPPSQQTVTFSTPHRLDTTQNTSFKRKKNSEDGRSSKLAHIEPGDAVAGESGNGGVEYATTWTYEDFAPRYYILIPSSSRTSEVRDIASKILTKVFGVSKSEGLDKYRLGLTEIYFGANMLAFLENLRTTRLNHCATVIQKNLKANYHRRRYLEARSAAVLIQSITRSHLAWKHIQETRRIKAAITVQRVWRGQKQRRGLNTICNKVILMQAAAKGFLRRREIMDTRVRKGAVLIQSVWRLRRYVKSWRQYKHKVVIVQSLWRGKCARRRCEEIRQVMASSDPVGQGDHGNVRVAELPAYWQTQVQRIKSITAIEDCQRFCYKVRHPITSIDVRPDQDALERSGGPDNISARDRRLKQLKFLMDEGLKKEKSLETPRIVLQVSRRVHLVELTASYEEALEAERASKKRGQPSVKERFVDVLFPHTIQYKTKKDREGGKGSKEGKCGKGEKGKKRKKGGKKRGLKKQISNLSLLLPGIVASEMPSKLLVIETIRHHELPDYPIGGAISVLQCLRIVKTRRPPFGAISDAYGDC